MIDTAKPEVKINSNGYEDGEWAQASVSLEVSNKTANLGTTAFMYQLNGGEWKTYTGTIVVGTDTKGDVYSLKKM